MKDKRERKEREEHVILVPWVRKTSIFYIFAWCFTVYKTQTTSHCHLMVFWEASTSSLFFS